MRTIKSTIERAICAIICLACLCPVLAGCIADVPQETTPLTDPDYLAMNGAAIEYLTAREFSSDRVHGQVSDEFRRAYAGLAMRLLRESRSEYEGSGLLISPYSATLALAMTANGASGETLAEMEKVLGGMPIEELNSQLFNYSASLISSDNAKFNLANAVWVTSSPRFSINRHFVDTIENTYDADIIAADLPSSISAINDWVRDETFGMIPTILNDGDLDERSIMVLLNALAFDALWAQQPSDDSCFESTFNASDGSAQRVDFMWAEANGYIKGKSEVGIVKNYSGGKYAFLAVMPEGDINEYVSSLTGDELLKLFDTRKTASNNIEIQAKMPQFSFDCQIDMRKVLERLGMPGAFDDSRADFSGMGTSTDGNIYIERVIQKTHIDLDNSGTRAAAVTAVILKDESAIDCDLEQYRVELDKPFIYAIIDTESGLPLFLGICESID